ncbi:MAG: CRISPR-associated endonuclease Cas2 [Eubacteriales bacterium]|nr:CRISPR-associated endonuclease Cas2 [Eubacteriales bacterium]
MRLIVMLNPTNQYGTKTAYTNFRKTLLADGFILWGQEVYMRVVTNRKSAETHIRRLKENHPNTGMIRIFQLTEKQYSSVYNLTGTDDIQENIIGKNDIIML